MPDTTFDRHSTTVTYEIGVAGAEPVKLRFGSTVFRPAKAEVTFRDGVFKDIKIEGPNVKKDGTDGANGHGDTYYAGWGRGEMPDWCERLIEDLRGAAEAAAQ